MQVTVEELGPITRKLKVVLPAEDVEKELDAAYQKLKVETKIKGFRKGKVPRRILEQNYGPRVRAEVGEKLVQASYFDALEQQRIDAVVHPDIKTHGFEQDGSFSYVAEVDTRPEFDLKEYKGMVIETEEVVVADSEIDEELARLRKEMAPLRSVEDRAVRADDIALVDFQGYHNGEPIPQVHGTDVSVDVGSDRNGKDFEENLIGLQKGENATFAIDFPAGSANPILAGKSVEFRLQVKEVKERVFADLDDEFAKDVNAECNTLADLKDHIAAKIRKRKEGVREGDITDKLMEALLAQYDFALPARLVQYEVEEYIKQMEKRLQPSGLTLETAGVNRDELAERYKEAAEKRVRGDFLIKKIASQEDIKVEEDDINAGFGRIAEQYSMSVDEVKRYFKSREDMLPFLSELLNEKVLKFLREQVVLKTVAAGQSEAGLQEAQTTGDAR